MAMAGGFSDSWMTNSAAATGQKGTYKEIVEARRRYGEICWMLLRTRRQVPRPAFCALPALPNDAASPSAASTSSSSSSSSSSSATSAATSATSAAAAAAAAVPEKSPAQVKREVLASDRLRYGLREICLETGRPMSELLAEAGAILDEMAHCLNMFTVRSFGYTVSKALWQIFRGVYVNTDGIAQVRKACSEYPVVFMPMHRSYADFLLISLVCYDFDLPLPAIASAMDFMGMRFIGSLLRNCGAFFIRRSFATDRVYWLTFLEYVKTHVCDGVHPVEFFIEGTRSRTGKSLHPKTGMLGAILEAWFMCEVPDVYLVPVSISYDRILEERLYAYELLGVPKPRESTSGLLKARALLSEDYGNVHMYFDQPISLRSFAQAYGGVDRSVHSLAPKVKAQLTEAEARMLKAVSQHVVVRHCANAVLSPFSLLAGLLLAKAREAPTPVAELADGLVWLRRQLVDLSGSAGIVDWPTGGSGGGGGIADARAVVRDQCRLHANLLTLMSASTSSASSSAAGGNDDDAVVLAEDSAVGLEERAALRLQLCSYRNHFMCHLVSPTLADAAATVAAAGSVAFASAYETLRLLLHREFPVVAEAPPSSPLAQRPGSPDGARLREFARACLFPCLIGYRLLCRTLLLDRVNRQLLDLTERQVAQVAQARAFAHLRSSATVSCWHYWDSVSLDLLTNAVHGLHRLRVLTKRGAGSAAGGVDWEALEQLCDMLDSVIDSEPEVSTLSKL